MTFLVLHYIFCTWKVELSHSAVPPPRTHPLPPIITLPHPSPQTPAGGQEIIHTASHTGVGVLYRPVCSTACLLSPAIEVIHGTIVLQLIVQENIATAPPPSQLNHTSGKLTPTRLIHSQHAADKSCWEDFSHIRGTSCGFLCIVRKQRWKH